MLRSLYELTGYDIQATDGSIGTVKDFLFDDRAWVVRYLVADTGKWLPGRKVLIVPGVLKKPSWEDRTVPVELTRQEVEESPDIAEDQPVSRQHEIDIHDYYAWEPYWFAYTGYEGPMAVPPMVMPGATAEPKARTGEQEGDPNLRSVGEVKGYHLDATDGEIGHVEDFILDEDGWIIRYVVADTRNWLPGKKVLLSPEWFDSVNWADRTVAVDLSKEGIRHSPSYDPTRPVNREDETALYDYYGRPVYWQEAMEKARTMGGL